MRLKQGIKKAYKTQSFGSAAFHSQHTENGLEAYQCRSQKTKLSLTAWRKDLVMAWYIRKVGEQIVGSLIVKLSNINLFMSNLTYYKCYTQMMSRDDARKFREECMTHFGWALTTFYVRLKGNCFTGPFEENEFIRILRKYNPNF